MNSKFIWVSLVVAVIALVLSLLALIENSKTIVYVDSLKLISNYKGAKIAKEAYEAKVAVWKANIDTLATELNAEIAAYEKSKKGMSQAQRNETEQRLGGKQQQLENYRKTTGENAAKEDQQITKRVFSEINDFLKRYGEQNGYEYIMAATNVGNIVYAKKGNDITDEVIKAINAQYRPVTK